MTDREKIRAYIEKLHKEHRGSEGDSIFRRALRTVLFYIDSMQEEHCTETEFREIEILRTKLSDIAKAIYYHEGKENPTVERIREIVQDCCFEIMDLKKPKQEEPVSEEWIEELRTKLNSMSKEDLKKVFDKYAIDFDEEPVSEDLEEAGKQYLERSNPDRVHQITNAFKAGTKWQKQQDTKILESIITNGKDYPTLDSFLNTFKMMQYGKIKM